MKHESCNSESGGTPRDLYAWGVPLNFRLGSPHCWFMCMSIAPCFGVFGQNYKGSCFTLQDMYSWDGRGMRWSDVMVSVRGYECGGEATWRGDGKVVKRTSNL